MPVDVDRGAVRRLMGEGAQVVEVLPRAEYQQDHLPGAVSLPLAELDAARAAAVLQRNRAVVVYCFDGQ